MAKGNGGGSAEGITVARISVKVSPNTKEFRRELKADLEDIERTVKGDVHITAHLDSAQCRADFNRLLAQMKAAGAKGVTINTRMSNSGSSNGGGSSPGGSGGSGSGGGRSNRSKGSGIGYPSFGSGINPAGYAVILAAVTALAAPLLGLITTTLLAIPGLIAMIAAPIAAITLGLEGFKKAAESIKPQFEALKQTMADAAQNSFTPVMQRIADEVFPKLQQSLPKVTEGLAQVAQGVVDGLSGPQMQQSIERIGAAFTAMRPGMEGFTSGFVGLIDQFTLKLPGISEWFNDVGTRFDAWIAKISADGSLGRAFDGLGTTIDAILESMGQLALSGLKWIQDPQKVADFVDGLKDLLGVLEDIAALSSTLTDLFANIVPDLSWDGFKKDFFGPLTSEDAPWRKIFGNGGHMFTNDITGEGGGTQGQIKAMESSINAVGAAADANKLKVDGFLNGGGGGANAQRIRRGLAPIQGPGLNGDMPSGAAAEVERPKVPEPDTSAAEAKLMEYQQTAAKTMGEAKKSIEEATSGATVKPPDLSGFTSGLDGLGSAAGKAMDQVVSEISGGGEQAKAAAQGVADGIRVTFESAGAQMVGAGLQICVGLAAGIRGGTSTVIAAAVEVAVAAEQAAKNALGIKSPSRKFMEIGDYSMQGMAIGMDKGFSGVLAQAKDMAFKISDVFSKDGDPTSLLAGFGNSEVNRMEKVLAFEMKRLNAQAKALDYQAKATGNEALKAQAEGLRMKREELSLQKDMIDLTQEFADLEGGDAQKFSDSPLGSMVQSMMDAPFDIGKQVGNQFMNDIGISGGGALGAIMDYGQQLGSKYIFNVSNIDEALSVKQNQQHREGLGVTSR